MIHLDLGEAATTRQWKQENDTRRHFKISRRVFTRLQKASSERKQSRRGNLGWNPLQNINILSGQTIHAQRARSCLPLSQRQTPRYPARLEMLLHHRLRLIRLITVQTD